MRIAGCRVHFVPPAETDQAPTGDIFEVVEICGKEKDGDNEDEDAIIAC